LPRTSRLRGLEKPAPTSDRQRSAESERGTLQIQNVVASVIFSERIDLEKIAAAFRDVERRDNFPGLVLKLSNPKTTILLFKSGKMILTGLKSRENAAIAVTRILKNFSKIGIDIKSEPIIEIQNIVASGDLGKQVDLDEASIVLERTIYEPEVFPGLIVRALDPKACFLVFSSGKIVCTGLRTEKDLVVAVKKMACELKDKNLLLDRTAPKHLVPKQKIAKATE
jgi:transcription initiation factor TFIID TATA-box-binding protein